MRTLGEAEVWCRAHTTVKWTHEIALEAWAMAERFNEPQLSSFVAGHIVFDTRVVQDDEPVTKSGSPEDDPETSEQVNELEELEAAELERRRIATQEAMPSELHRRAFELIGKLVETHGDELGIRVISRLS